MFFSTIPFFATFLADAAEAVPAAASDVPPAQNQLLLPLVMVLFFAGFWFMFIRPQQKRQKEIQQKQSQLKTGDRVATTAGILGKVVSIDGETVTLQVSEGVRIPFQRQAIVAFFNDEKDKADK